MAGFSFDTAGLGALVTDLDKIADGIVKNEKRAVKLAGQAYANDVKVLAPYKTGTYRRSIHVETTTDGLRQVALVGTNVQYGRRLEYGFYGADSAGRNYQQYPRPHWRPAWDANLDKYIRIMFAALNGEAVDISEEFWEKMKINRGRSWTPKQGALKHENANQQDA